MANKAGVGEGWGVPAVCQVAAHRQVGRQLLAPTGDLLDLRTASYSQVVDETPPDFTKTSISSYNVGGILQGQDRVISRTCSQTCKTQAVAAQTASAYSESDSSRYSSSPSPGHLLATSNCRPR
jgi:hypothetical protein